MMSTELTIKEVEQQFKAWRLKKKGREKIPDCLWDAVQQLTTRYTPSTIIKHLKLSTRQMKRKGLGPLLGAQPEEKPPPFVNIKLSPQLGSQPQMVIQRADGAQLTCANLSDKQLVLSVKTFLSPVCE